MFEISETMEKKLQSLKLIDYLQVMHERIEEISHQSKTNTAYEQCQSFARHIKHRIVTEFKISWEDFDMNIGKNLRQSEEILDLYKYSDSDKKKSARIKEFVSEYTYDLSKLITKQKISIENSQTNFDPEEN